MKIYDIEVNQWNRKQRQKRLTTLKMHILLALGALAIATLLYLEYSGVTDWWTNIL